MDNNKTSGSPIASVRNASNMVTREVKSLKEGNIPEISGVIILILVFILFKKSIKAFKTLISIVVVLGILLYLGTLWG